MVKRLLKWLSMSSKGTKGLKGLKTNRQCGNRNVSVPTLSEKAKYVINYLRVEPRTGTAHGNSKAVRWTYFGSLKFCPTDDKEVTLDSSRLYCKLCLDDIRRRSAEGSSCRISAVGNFSPQTASGNLNFSHLFNRHNVDTVPEDKLNKMCNTSTSIKLRRLKMCRLLLASMNSIETS